MIVPGCAFSVGYDTLYHDSGERKALRVVMYAIMTNVRPRAHALLPQPAILEVEGSVSVHRGGGKGVGLVFPPQSPPRFFPRKDNYTTALWCYSTSMNALSLTRPLHHSSKVGRSQY